MYIKIDALEKIGIFENPKKGVTVMRKMLVHSMQLLKDNWKNILFFELLYRIGTFLIITGLCKLLADACLKLLNYRYLTSENYINFISHPLVIVGMVFIVLIILLFLLIEICTIMIALQCSWFHQKLILTDMVVLGFRKAGKVIKRCPIGWIINLIFLIPFLGIIFMTKQLADLKFIRYGFLLLLGKVQGNINIVLLFFICYTIVAVILIFTLPICIIQKKNFLSSVREGFKISFSHWRQTWGRLILLNLGLDAFVVVVYVLGLLIEGGAVYLLRPSGRRISALIPLIDLWQVVVGVLAMIICILVNLAVIYTMYMTFLKEAYEDEDLKLQYPRIVWNWLHRYGRQKSAVFLCVLVALIELVTVVYFFNNRINLATNLIADIDITAHRGGAILAPENTLASLAEAAADGSDYAEIDVQETKDGVLILLHDSNLKRTTGKDMAVWDMTYEEIGQLDAGSYFSEEYAGEPIPTLQEALDFCRGRLNLNIEIKYNGHNDKIVEKVVDLVTENQFTEHSIITSMNYGFLKRIKERNELIKTGYIMTMGYGSIKRLDYADLLSVNYASVDEKLVREAHRLGKEVHVWTVNSKNTTERLKNLGVDNIITDRPALVRAALAVNEGEDFWGIMRYAIIAF